MAELMIPDVEESMLQRLHERASARGSTTEAEARLILAEALQPTGRDGWAQVNAIRQRLAASGRTFSDSSDLIREDRDR